MIYCKYKNNKTIMKDHAIYIRMDKKLYKQLKRYAEKNDEGQVATAARKALKKFLDENLEEIKNQS